MAPWMVVGCVTASLVLFGILERFLNAVVSTVWYMTIGFDQGEAKYSFGAMQLLTYSASSVTRVVTAVSNVLISSLTGVLSWAILALALLFLTGMMYIAYEEYPLMAR